MVKLILRRTDAFYRQQNNYDNFKNGGTCGGPCSNRKEIIYAGANNGILHAFEASMVRNCGGIFLPMF